MRMGGLRKSICIRSFVLGVAFAYGTVLVYTLSRSEGEHSRHPYSNEVRTNQENDGTTWRLDDGRHGGPSEEVVRHGEPSADEVRHALSKPKWAEELVRLLDRYSFTGRSARVVDDAVRGHQEPRTSTAIRIAGDGASRGQERTAGNSNVRGPEPAEVRCIWSKGSPAYDPALDCRRRLPHVIGIGVEKCGSGALSFFLKMHPHVAHSVPKELYYWNKHASDSLDSYRNMMPMSSKYQVSMEFTPSYIFGRDIPGLIKERAPNTKFIVMLRDPIQRAVSQFLHVQHFHWEGVDDYKPLIPGRPAHPFVNDTFETTVVNRDGDILEGNAIVENGQYGDHLRRWFDVFPRDRFLVIDEGEFSKDPMPTLRRVETFVGLPSFFEEDMIYFDTKRGIHCQAWPQKKCLDRTKGRTHPAIRDDVFQTLDEFYRPHNADLSSLLHRKFSWM